MKTTTRRWILLILSIIAPLLYLSMHFPIWGGKELSLANTDVLHLVLFVFQCICLLFAILCLCFTKLRNGNSCWITLVTIAFFVASVVLTCFVGSFFTLELLGVPWFPAQR